MITDEQKKLIEEIKQYLAKCDEEMNLKELLSNTECPPLEDETNENDETIGMLTAADIRSITNIDNNTFTVDFREKINGILGDNRFYNRPLPKTQLELQGKMGFDATQHSTFDRNLNRPQRDFVIKSCLALELGIESDEVFASAKYQLHDKDIVGDTRDRVIRYCLNNKKSIEDTNEALNYLKLAQLV